MAQIGPSPPMESTWYLHSHLYPLWFILEARVSESASYIQPHFKTAFTRQEFVPPGEYVLGQTRHLVPSTVLVDCNVYFFKPWVSGRVHGYHELQSYRKILAGAEASLLLANARICRLHGLIIDNDIDALQHYALDSNEEDHPGTCLVGLLLTNIENKGTHKELAPWSDCANNDRLCWSRQIHQSVEQLHNADVVWGDAKPENVLIDTKGDAWLIDFGGSYTPGWIDKDKRETVEGDWQGVQRIDKWLTKYSCKPVPRINKLIEKEQ
ncbi:hypothetical protein LOZ58_003876 [Ophidiomyces ophidiicola]|nr:hypothetical protein LOZ58_003876 [Ophidiomyces ophidiicola]